MKKKLFKGIIAMAIVVSAIFAVSLSTVNAASVYEDSTLQQFSLNVDESSQPTFSLEEMLTYALQDEFMAQAEYQAIIANYGEIAPFANIVEAEQTHIDLLLPLFAQYGIEVPANDAADRVIIPESITSALATGVDAEKANIAMYQAFLAQDNLPDDVRNAFEYLMNASENHLQAFSQDRYAYLGEDAMSQIRNQFRKAFQGASENGNQNQMQYKYQGSRGQMAGSGSQQLGSGNQQSGNGNCGK